MSERDVKRKWCKGWGKWSSHAVVALTVVLDAAPLREATAPVADRPTPRLGL